MAVLSVFTVFTWQAAVAIVYTALWNIGLYCFNTRSPLWRKLSHVNLVLMSNTRTDLSCGPPQKWFAWDLASPRHLVSPDSYTMTIGRINSMSARLESPKRSCCQQG
jgi:hypothetical protein